LGQKQIHATNILSIIKANTKLLRNKNNILKASSS